MAIVERMRKRHRRVDPFQAMLSQGKRTKKGRRDGQGMHGGTYVVDKTRQRQRE
jgi:hypothetical protein